MSNNSFTDLVLLVGTNPLPNYVVAKYFILENKDLQRIWLVHSEKTNYQEGTGSVAGQIIEVLKKEFPQWFQHNQVKNPIGMVSLSDVGQAEKIFTEIADWLGNNREGLTKEFPNSAFHLNYTGGTKSMAVHVYRAIENTLGKANHPVSFSYLDARDFKIKLDGQGVPLTNDLRDHIAIDLTYLMHLHNYTLKKEDKDYFDRVYQNNRDTGIKLMEGLITLLGDGNPANNHIMDFRDWVQKSNSSPSIFDSSKTDITNECVHERLKHYEKADLLEFLKTFPENDRFVNLQGKWVNENLAISGRGTKAKLKDFLTGKWLEAYVYYVLDKKICEYQLQNKSQVVNNWHLLKSRRLGSIDFEIDVMVTNGYELCGISCGTSLNRDTLKLKGFEIIHRTGQIGGEEARTMLVTLMNGPDARDLEDDISAMTGSDHKHFIILGCDDLPEPILWKKLAQHIFDLSV